MPIGEWNRAVEFDRVIENVRQTTRLCRSRLTRPPLQRTRQLGDGSERKAVARDFRVWSGGPPRHGAESSVSRMSGKGGVTRVQAECVRAGSEVGVE